MKLGSDLYLRVLACAQCMCIYSRAHTQSLENQSVLNVIKHMVHDNRVRLKVSLGVSYLRRARLPMR